MLPLPCSCPALLIQKKNKYSTVKIVHKILIGTRHRDVAVEWAAMFKLAMNLKSASESI
jgi:ABC-type uncharacterized transport system substrate-binding protein